MESPTIHNGAGTPGIVNVPLPEGLGDYDAIADLFLHDIPFPPQGAPANGAANGHANGHAKPSFIETPRPGMKDTVEGLILGHLPVLAAAWVGQYARWLSEAQSAAVALLRVQGGHISVELIGAQVADWRADIERAMGPSGMTLEVALRLAAARTRMWLVRADDLSESELADSSLISGLTLLTGADRAALVKSYQTIKTLCDREEKQVALRVAVMGATADEALAAREKIAGTAAAHMGREIPVLHASQKIGAAPSLTLFRAASTLSVGAVVERIHAAADRRVYTETPAASRIGPTARTTARTASIPPAAPGELPEPKPTVSSVASSAAPDELARHIAGLKTLAARCPFAREVELAGDPEGALHLLIHAQPGAIDLAVHQLTAVSGWIAEHAELVRMASPGINLSSHVAATLHLLTDQPREARRLLDSNLRVHLLAEVRIGETMGWFFRTVN